ncbi:ATP-binding cassette domain-containing protein, partial [Staphylococcus epidermidis]|uniref:ATP-binding cassette domain-containing protein n=1 Tax=Staphylococcus epidermidis TaxID=1282 RepID=UPI0037DA44D3
MHTYKQKHLPHIKKHIPIIFQHFNFLNSKSLYKNLPIPLILTNTNNKEINQKLHQILQFLPLPHKKHQFPHQLSPPQKQPLPIPTPLLTHPKILLSHQPTTPLHPPTTTSILNLLSNLNPTFPLTII